VNGEEVSSFFSFAVGEDEGTRAKALVAKRRERRNQNPPRRPRRVKEKLPPTASFWSSLRRVFLFFRRICYCCCCCFWWWWCSFFVSPLVQKPFFSLVFFRGNNNIHKSPGAHTIHFSVPISFFSLAGTTRVVIIFCCLQITHHLQTIHKKREKASARAVECKRSEAKLIRNSSRENFIHTQIEFDIHATRIYQSGSFLFSRVHFIILILRLFGEKANLRAT